MKYIVLLSLLLWLPVTGWAQTAAPPVVPAQTAPRFELDQYQFALLKRGPNWTAERTPAIEKLQAGHMANINRMAQLGKLMAAGPMLDNGDWAGIFVFKAASMDEAKALAAEDPAVKAGRLTLEFFTWLAPKGIGVKFSEAFRQDPKTKTTMTKYYFALLKKGAQWTAEDSPALQQLQRAHLWHIRRSLDAGQYVSAGPLAGHADWLGIVVIAANSLTEARAVAEADPIFKTKRAVYEYHEWLCAKEVWP